MMTRTKAAAIALALVVTGCGDGDDDKKISTGPTAPPMLTAIAAPNNGDWTQIVTETPEGGFRMGNPEAPVKLVEYASITCHVCAEFSETGSQPLQSQYVRSGQVSWEYRPFMLFPSDPAVFSLLRCQGATPFFGLAEQLYDTQAEWAGRLQSLSPERAQQLQNMAPSAQAAGIIEVTQLASFFRQRGMPEARINSCLADATGFERLAEITRTGVDQHDIRGTPTFLINGEKQDVTAWSQLEQRLRKATGS